MPRILKDIECSMCGYMPDVLIEQRSIQPFTKGGYNCVCECGAPAKLVWSKPPMTAGIIWSNQEHSSQLGVTFETNAQKRAYMREHGLREYGKGTPDERKLADRIHTRAEGVARRMGYDDLDHKRRVEARERARGWDPRRHGKIR